MPYGNYIIKEILPPDGYLLTEKAYSVTISEDKEMVDITIGNDSIKVAVSKEDVYGEELSGAQMQLLDESGEIVEEWTSDGTNHVISEIPAGSYTLKEIAAPEGYLIASDISFAVDAQNMVTVENVEVSAFTEDGIPLITMVDDTTAVKISKVDITGDEELPDAKLQIIASDGTIVEEWISSKEPHYIEKKLVAGDTYTLREITAPNGYVLSEEIEFTVNSDGSVTEVIMKDDTTKVRISKIDITTEKELPNAKLQVLDDEDKIVEEWISGTEPHYIEGKLIAGKTYTLREITAPDGYEIANDVTDRSCDER